MTTIDRAAAAAALLSEPLSSEVLTIRQYVCGLRRSLVVDGIGDDVYDALEKLLGHGREAPSRRRPRRALATLGLVPRRRPVEAPSIPAEEAARISERFRNATTQLVQIAPYRVWWTPTEKLQVLRDLRAHRPNLQDPDEYMAYLRRYARALSDVLDILGDG